MLKLILILICKGPRWSSGVIRSHLVWEVRCCIFKPDIGCCRTLKLVEICLSCFFLIIIVKVYIIKILNLYSILLFNKYFYYYYYLHHFFPASIHYLQCIHCLLHYKPSRVLSNLTIIKFYLQCTLLVIAS